MTWTRIDWHDPLDDTTIHHLLVCRKKTFIFMPSWTCSTVNHPFWLEWHEASLRLIRHPKTTTRLRWPSFFPEKERCAINYGKGSYYRFAWSKWSHHKMKSCFLLWFRSTLCSSLDIFMRLGFIAELKLWNARKAEVLRGYCNKSWCQL